MTTLRSLVPFALVALAMTTAPVAHGETSPLEPLVSAAAQRLLTADPVAAYKWVNGGSIEDPARVAQVLDAVGADARGRGIDEGFVREVFEHQIHATEGVEYILFGHWKFHPADAPTAAPDLTESRTAIDGFNKVMVAELAARWDVLLGPGCQVALDEARAAVVSDRGLDPLHADGLSVATATYCETT